MKLARRLKDLRQSTGMGLKTLARRVRVDHAYLSRIEAGRVHPSEQIIRRLAKTLRHDEAELMLLADHVPPAWRKRIQSAPDTTASLIRDALERIQPDGDDDSSRKESVLSEEQHGQSRPVPEMIQADCFEWLSKHEKNSIHAVITDPPFGLLEYTEKELQKLRSGRGGVWRLPPTIGGCERKPLPRFTVLSREQLNGIRTFFEEWGKRVMEVLVPGGHIMIASNPLLAPFLSYGLVSVGLERRGSIIRLVRTLRGGDRPKQAEEEFSGVCVMPRSCYEPWELFRKPLSEKTVAANLRRWKVGGLRRTPDGRPFPDVLKSEFPLALESEIAPHPTLKPQRFLRQLAWAALPLGEGTILDPFMGSGSTLAAAAALGYRSIGIELDPEFMKLAEKAVPNLQKVQVEWRGFESSNGALGQLGFGDYLARTSYAGSR